MDRIMKQLTNNLKLHVHCLCIGQENISMLQCIGHTSAVLVFNIYNPLIRI